MSYGGRHLLVAQGTAGAGSSGGGGGVVSGYDGTVAISGSNFVNGHGTVIQLRGASLTGYANAMNQGENQSPADASGGTYNFDQAYYPIMSRLQAWNFNCVRIGIAEGSWLGTTGACPGSPNTRNADPSNVYKTQITTVIAQLNAIGCYVNLTMASTCPGTTLGAGQSNMANQDNTVAAWTSIAQWFGYPNGTQLKRNGGTVDDRSVLFELFNEPYCDFAHLSAGGFWQHNYDYNPTINQGSGAGQNGSFTQLYPYPATIVGTFIPNEAFTTTSGTVASGTVGSAWTGTNPHIDLWSMSTITLALGTVITGSVSGATATTINASPGYGWWVAGHNQMINAIRGTGAWNPCLCAAGTNFNQDISQFATYAPNDSAQPSGYSGPAWAPQIAATWHPYPNFAKCTAVAVASGGSGYTNGDTILLPMSESGGTAGTVYWQQQLLVTNAVGGIIQSGGVALNTYVGGTPGVSGGDNGQYSYSPFNGGVYAADFLPANPVGQYSSSGGGSGATFNLTLTKAGKEGDSANWPTFVGFKITPGMPLFITETGEHTGTGINGSPLMAEMTAWVDANGISFEPYGYNPNPGWYSSTGYDYALALSNGAPTPGYGAFMYNWFTTHAP